MDELFEAYIIHTLKETGYTNCSNRALQMFKAIFMKKMMYHCKSLKQVTHHATRHKSIALDIFNIEKDPTVIAELPGTTLNFEVEVYKPKEKFVNEIASKIDRYIHIYEFMPEFPPTHTFKRSYIRNAKKHEIRIKQRVEQNLLAERSVFQMVSMEGKMPRHVNFMDYMEK